METKEVNKLLPEAIKSNFNYLQKELKEEDLKTLNPITIEILNIKKKADELVLVKEENGNFNKDCISDYKNLKAEIRAFNGKLTKSAKKLKEPYLKIQKAVVAIEKEFKGISSEIQSSIKNKFSEYEKEQEKIKLEKQRKKDEALLKEIEETRKEAEELKKKTEINTVYNSILNKEINDSIVIRTMHVINTSNLETIISLKENLLKKEDFNLLSNRYNLSILPEDLLFELKRRYSESIKNSISLINDKIKNIELEKENMKLEVFKEMKTNSNDIPLKKDFKTIEKAIEPLTNRFEVDDFKIENLSNEEFYNYVKREINVLKELINKRFDENRIPDPFLHTLKKEFDNIKLL